MFVFGPDPRTVNNIKDKLVDFANKCGFSSNIIFIFKKSVILKYKFTIIIEHLLFNENLSSYK